MPDQTVNPFDEAQNKVKESQDSAAKPNEREDFAKHVGDEVRSKAVSKGQMAGLKEGIENKPQDAPVNPFQQGASSLPPKGYEDLEKNKSRDTKSKFNSEPAPDVEMPTVPVNPFDITSSTPVRPLDSRPLEEKEKVDVGVAKPTVEVEEEQQKPEEIGEAKEVQQVGAEESAGVEEAVVGEVVDEQEKAKSENAQPIEPEIVDVTPPSIENLTEAEPEEFKEELWDILEHAGITKKRILYFFIFVVLVVVAIFFLFSSGGGEERPREKEVEKEEVEEEVVVDVVEGEAADLEAAYIFGLEHQPIEAQPVVTWGSTAGYEAGFIFGSASDLKEHAFVQRVELVRKLDNMYRTDIYNFVNLATDRRAALTNHLRELDDLIKDGQAAVAALNSELEDLSSNYTKISEQRDAQEVVFFDQLNALLGQSSYDNLQVFVESGQLALKLKADFRAKEVLRDKLVLYLGALEPRYADISANFEALVKGVRVFDVPDSDIDAIVPVE